MFCTKCGANNAPDTRFCTACGNPLTEEAAQASVATAAPQAAPQSSFDFGKLKNTVVDFFNNKVKPLFAKKAVLYGTIAGAVVIVAIIVLCIVLTPSKTRGIDTIIDIAMNENYDKISSLAPESYWEYLEEEYDIDADDRLEAIEKSYEDQMEDLQHRKNYGDVSKITYKITKEKDVSESRAKSIREDLKDAGVRSKEISNIVEVSVDFTIVGEDDGEESATLYLVKIAGDWYTVKKNDYFGVYSLCFYLTDLFDITSY